MADEITGRHRLRPVESDPPPPPSPDVHREVKTVADRLTAPRMIAIFAGSLIALGAAGEVALMRVASKADVAAAVKPIADEQAKQKAIDDDHDRKDEIERAEIRAHLNYVDQRLDWLTSTLYPVAIHAGIKAKTPPPAQHRAP